MEDGYTRRAHSVSRLSYHAVFVIKYRRKVMDREILDYIEVLVRHLVEEKYNGRLLEVNGEADHLHILFELPPTMAPATAVNSLKTQISKEVRARYMDRIRDRLWGDSFWSDSYFLSTTGGADIQTLENYIQQQGVERPKRKYTRRKR